MELVIDTTQSSKIILWLLKQGQIAGRRTSQTFRISENLLQEIEKLLEKQKIALKHLKKIFVKAGPGGFSSVRTGVATANALAYALDIPVAEWPSGKIKKIVLPKYDKAPNITKPKRK
jgi:tRNA threonylcarbamoyladenosine biosynthesis protein TsaB